MLLNHAPSLESLSILVSRVRRRSRGSFSYAMS
jgi:hypothetical protein